MKAMDLKKIIKGEYESLFYSINGEAMNHKISELLGYKEGIPVLRNAAALGAKNPPTGAPVNKTGTKQTLMVEVNSKTGEKFINLNGKKLRMVAESQFPTRLKQNAQVTKVSEKKPVKIKIIGSMPSVLYGPGISTKKDTCQVTDINSSNTSVNKTDNADNIEIIHTTPVKIPSTAKAITGNTTAAAGSVIYDPVTHTTTHQQNGRCLNNLTISPDDILKSPNGVLKMNPLDLSKVGGVKVEVRKTDSSVQTSVETVEKSVQTDEEDDLLNILNIDFLEYLSSNSSNTVVTPTVKMTPKVAETVPTPAHSEKFKMFFQDLRTAMIPDINGNRPIHVGVLNNNPSFVKRSCSVLKALQTPVDILNHGDLTALQLAILNDSDPLIVKTLLAHGARLDMVDTDGNNIIHLAIEWKRTDMLDILLRFADEQNFNLDDFNAEGLTPLMMCCDNGLVQCAELLLKYDADVNVRDRKSGRTALFHAAESHIFEMVQLLLNYNADTKIKNFFGTSPHDAMYEVDEIPENIKGAILGKNSKRKAASDEPKIVKVRKIEENATKLKTYARYKKIEGYELPVTNLATKAK